MEFIMTWVKESKGEYFKCDQTGQGNREMPTVVYSH